MIELNGRLAFAPDRGDGFRKIGKLNTLVLELRGVDSVAHYYRQQVLKEYGPWCNLAPPMFGLHVTVIRGYGDKFDEEQAAAEAGKPLTVYANPEGLARTPWAKKNPGFWYLPVRSKELTKIRQRCATKAVFPYEPHLTIGRESPAFMHAKARTDVLSTAFKALKLVPDPRKSGDRETGNQQLIADLVTFLSSWFATPRDPMCTGEELMKLIHRHVKLPVAKAWERQILNLFEYKGLMS